MAKTGLIGTFNQALTQEKVFELETSRTGPARSRHRVQQEIVGLVNEARSGGLETILAIERRFLENDKSEYANSPAMRSSLDTALKELAVAERLCAVVQDPVAYRLIAVAHSLPKNQRGGLPLDEARQFFGSHAARLLNQDKARLAPAEKTIIDARKQNMRLAVKLYEARQRQALGLTAPGREPGMEM